MFVSLLVLSACSLMTKNQASNEMEELVHDSLKADEGVDIRVMPIHLEKK